MEYTERLFTLHVNVSSNGKAQPGRTLWRGHRFSIKRQKMCKADVQDEQVAVGRHIEMD